MSSPSPHHAPGKVRAWYASTDVLDDPARVRAALAWLSPAERNRYDRFRRDEDRRMFLLGRLMARTLVGRAAGVAPDGWQWREGAHGRPEIAAPTTPVRFNLAHSAGLVVCAIASGRDVGVDVEDLARVQVDRAVVRRYCSAQEVADVEAQPDHAWHDRFLLYWTLKEAYLKARGLGISVPLADICFTVGATEARIGFLDSLAATDTRWAFHVTRPTARHLLAVAASTADGTIPAFSVEPCDVGDAGRL